jgi:SAM-dependent methyltransferase
MCACPEARILGRRLNVHQGLRARRAIGVATTVVRCEECGLIFANPRPIADTLADHYGVAPEDYWRPGYFDGSDDCRYYIDKFRRLWLGGRAPRVLDIGAGIGKTMAALESQGFDVFGLEPSHEFRERAIANGIAPDRLRLAAIEDVEYEPQTFDLVSLCAVLEHVNNPAAAIERALSWTRREGLLLVEVPSARWLLGRLLNVAYRAQGLDYVTNLSPMHPPYHLYEFTLDSFARHSGRAGYEIVTHRYLPCDTYLPRGAATVAAKIMAATGTGMELELWLRPVS